MVGLLLPLGTFLYTESVLSVQETTGDNHSAEAHPTDDLEVSAEIIPKDVLLRYFGFVEVASPPASPIGIHRERVDESLAKGIPTNKKEFHALKASLLQLSKKTTDSPVLATTYNDITLALSDLFSLHRMAKDSHDEAVTALQHLGSLRQEKNRNQTSFNDVSADTQAFTKAPSTVVAEPLLGAEREVQAGAVEVVAVVVAKTEREIAGTQDAQAAVDSADPETSVTVDILQPLAGRMPTNSTL
ncbi:hypothetical protein K7X08_002650 [Anisodus acutangulus]|uniref:Uncharacterized protein n=1 Tax=Anisodus acutangulus TaxID=402998 RepID=A0A9Q1R4B2_9SOLA|nr:hypothetical protein K7X08_002650 [Anisodus acutangulus]